MAVVGHALSSTAVQARQEFQRFFFLGDFSNGKGVSVFK